MCPSCEWDDEDEVITVGLGSADTSSEGAPELSEMLLDLSLAMTRLRILLAEADESVWRTCGSRLALLRDEIAKMPAAPKPRRRIGFGPGPAKRVKKRRG